SHWPNARSPYMGLPTGATMTRQNSVLSPISPQIRDAGRAHRVVRARSVVVLGLLAFAPSSRACRPIRERGSAQRDRSRRAHRIGERHPPISADVGRELVQHAFVGLELDHEAERVEVIDRLFGGVE